jgi:hypothetical protein
MGVRNNSGPERFLDAYRRSACKAMLQTGFLRGTEDISRWEEDVTERFKRYREARVHGGEDTDVGTVFACYILPGQDPNSRLASVMDEVHALVFNRRFLLMYEIAFWPKLGNRIVRGVVVLFIAYEAIAWVLDILRIVHMPSLFSWVR